jgi:hypothetical protein
MARPVSGVDAGSAIAVTVRDIGLADTTVDIILGEDVAMVLGKLKPDVQGSYDIFSNFPVIQFSPVGGFNLHIPIGYLYRI